MYRYRINHPINFRYPWILDIESGEIFRIRYPKLIHIALGSVLLNRSSWITVGLPLSPHAWNKPRKYYISPQFSTSLQLFVRFSKQAEIKCMKYVFRCHLISDLILQPNVHFVLCDQDNKNTK